MPIPAADPAVDGVTATITGPVKLPGGLAPLEGTWYAHILTVNGATIDADGTIRAGVQSVYDDGNGAEMTLPLGAYEFTFRSSTLGPGGQPVTLGPYPYALTEDTLWGVIMETPTEVPITQSDVDLAQEAAAEAVAANEAAQLVGTTNDDVIAGRLNLVGTATRAAADNLYPSRTARTKHAPAFGLFFPEAEGALGAGAVETTQVQAALTAAAGRTLHIERGQTFVVDTLTAPAAGIKISGGGTLKFKNNTAAFSILYIADATNVDIDGVTFDGNVANQTTWSEFRHAVQIVGTSSNIRVRNCTFKNLVGDGVYIFRGFPTPGGIPSNVRVTGCTFLGSNLNRNGVSIISGEGIQVDHNFFDRMSRDAMPGAIDIEPNNTGDHCRNIIVAHNTIQGSTVTAVQQKGVVVNNNSGSDCTNILIDHNTIRGSLRYHIAVFGNNVDRMKTQALVCGNTIETQGAVVTLSAAIIGSALATVDISDNTIRGAGVEIGIKSVGTTFHVTGNTIRECTQYGFEALGDTAEAGILHDNRIEDCGTNANAVFGGIHIRGSNLTITDNRVISSATSKSQLGLYVETGTQNFIEGNHFLGMGVRAMNTVTAPQVFGHNAYVGGGSNIVSGTYPPATGTWVAGNVILNPAPTAGGPVRWTCTTGGTPGTWVAATA